VHEGEAGVGGAESWPRAALVRVEEAFRPSKADSLTVIIRSTIFKMVLRRTMMLKEAGESSEALPGLSRTTPFAVLIEGGWYPKCTRGLRRSSWIVGLTRLIFFHTE